MPFLYRKQHFSRHCLQLILEFIEQPNRNIHTLQYTAVFSETTENAQKDRCALLIQFISYLLTLVQYSSASNNNLNAIIIAHPLLPEP